MTRVFISYSATDSKFAKQLVSDFEKTGLEPWYFEDPDVRGGQIVEKIGKAIDEADAFLALLSVDYLKSETCKHEGSMAFNREKSLRKNNPDASFVFVAKVGPVDFLEAGFWSNYDWFDLTGPNQQDQIEILIARIKGDRAEKPKLFALDRTSWQPSFQNREPELDRVIEGLTNIAGPHFWLISSATQMGKTWFLEELAKRVQRAGDQWVVKSVDLRASLHDARRDADSLLSLFFDLVSKIPIDENGIAANISKSGKPCLILLDSAELLQETTEESLRQKLARIYSSVSDAGNRNIRLAFVAASRRVHQKWRGIRPAPQFRELILSPFDENVVEVTLRDMASQDRRTFSDDRYRDLAKSLYRVTEGLPALLVKYLRWICDVGYVGLDRIESQGNFDELARPYVRDILLSADSLLPSGGRRFERDTLELALLGLSHYRLITRAHIGHAIAKEPTLKTAMTVLGWAAEGLWDFLEDTYLVRPTREPWLVVYPAIRRLLFRYQHPSAEKQATEHLLAEEFYKEWENLEGIEQWSFSIERLWHRAEYLRLLRADDASRKLEEFVATLFPCDISHRIYTRQDVHKYVRDRVFESEEGLGIELQETVEGIEKGLLGRLLQVIESSDSKKE